MTEIDEAETILSALRARRSVGRVTSERPPRALVARVIEAATWAPNHHHTAPWRFVVLAGDARLALGEVMARTLRDRLPEPETAQAAALLEKERAKPLRAPVLIAVAVVPSPDQRVVEIEEVAAVAAGVQNMLLAAAALGLGAMWRTGEAAYAPTVKRFLGLPEESHLLAFVYLGYPAMPPHGEHATDAGPSTVWRGWDDPSA